LHRAVVSPSHPAPTAPVRALAAFLAAATLGLLATAGADAAEGPGCVVRPFAAGTAALRASGPGAAPGPPALAPAAPTGNLHLLVILARFSDVPQRAPVSRFQSLLFGSGPSVADYYAEASGGLLDVTGDLFGWVTLPQTQSYYSGGIGGVGSYPNNGQRMAEHAVTAALNAYPLLDLGDYDSDGDGAVDALLVIHSGQGFEWAGATGSNAPSSSPDPQAINSHKWTTQQKDFGSGAEVADYFTCPELQLVNPIVAPAWTDSVATVGVYCHELGHMFGLPDFYDTRSFANHVSAWDIMDFGTWNRRQGIPAFAVPGALPGLPSAWSRMFLGWTAAEVVSPAAGETVEDARTLVSASLGGAPLQLLANPFGVDWTPAAGGTGEYFLAEVRTRDGYDAGLPAEGLLLYHVDESRRNNDASRNGDGGALLRLLPQDGVISLDPGDRTDPWPGAQNAFGPASVPDSRLWNGNESGVALSGIGAVTGSSVSLALAVTNLAGGLTLPFARPNPYRPSAHGTVGLVFTPGSAAGAAGVGIYDLLGRRVRTLGPGDLDAASGLAVWNGIRDDGGPAVAGVYFFRLEGGAGSTGRIALIR
jgi:immune inhibitor A